MWLLLFILLSAITVDARVTFDKSEVLDNVDLKGTNSASFRCSGGCRVYAITESDSLVIVDEVGNVQESLNKDIANFYELLGGKYFLKNTGPSDPVFVFYAVEKGAANYDTTVLFVGNGTPQWIEANNKYTFLSISGAVGFWIFTGFTEGDPLPSVYAAGADAIDSCRPVFSASSVATLVNTNFAVFSPIATISFNGGSRNLDAGAGKFLFVDGRAVQSTMFPDSSAVYVSPGYVGCPSVGDSLYSLVPPIPRIKDDTTLASEKGNISVTIHGDYSIANQADAIALTVNDDAMKLYGNDSISKKYEDTKFNIKLAWTKKNDSKDGFAMQIDIVAKKRVE